MTNREWLNGLSNEKLAQELLPPHCECEYCIINAECNHICGNCYDKIAEWLGQEVNPMPEIKKGDIFVYKQGKIPFFGVCVYGNIVYLPDKGKCFYFGGEIKENIVIIKRYDSTKGTMEEIWGAGDE